MKLFRYRRPSLKTILGITKAKERIKKDLGITAILKPFAPGAIPSGDSSARSVTNRRRADCCATGCRRPVVAS